MDGWECVGRSLTPVKPDECDPKLITITAFWLLGKNNIIEAASAAVPFFCQNPKLTDINHSCGPKNTEGLFKSQISS